MTNLLVKDGAAANKYLKTSGAGTDGDPHIPEHKETSAAAILAALGGTLVVGDGGGSLTVDGPLTDTQLRATAVPISDGGGSLTMDIASAAWTEFYVALGAGDSTGDHTIIATPGAGHALQFCELEVIAGETAANTALIKNGATSIRGVPMASQMDGWMLVRQYPDYLTFAENAALVVNTSAAKILYVQGSYRIIHT